MGLGWAAAGKGGAVGTQAVGWGYDAFFQPSWRCQGFLTLIQKVKAPWELPAGLPVRSSLVGITDTFSRKAINISDIFWLRDFFLRQLKDNLI